MAAMPVFGRLSFPLELRESLDAFATSHAWGVGGASPSQSSKSRESVLHRDLIGSQLRS